MPWDLPAAIVSAIVTALYAVLKEVPDCYLRGGRGWDCMADTAFVALGATYAGPWAWPWVVLGAVGAGVVVRLRDER